MLRDCIKLTERQTKVLLVLVCTFAVLVLLSLLDPGYKRA
jgi:hypothetical protein